MLELNPPSISVPLPKKGKDIRRFKLERHPRRYDNKKKANDKTLKTVAKVLEPTYRNQKLEIDCSE